MSTRFKDLCNFVIPDWVINPFMLDSQQAQQAVQTELIQTYKTTEKPRCCLEKKTMSHLG